MAYRRVLILAILLLLVRPLAGDDATTQPTSEPHDYSVLQVTGMYGKVELRPITADQVRQTLKDLDEQFQKAIREWNAQADAFYKEPGNSYRSFDLPKPSHPTTLTLRGHLTQAEAVKLIKHLQEEEQARKKRTFYRSMLGTYRDKSGTIPFVNVSVPNGQDVLTPEMQRHLEGKIVLPVRRFEATGRINIPYDGQYVIDAVGTVQLNDRSMRGRGRPPSVHLDRGIYTVKITALTNNIKGTRISIRVMGSDVEIPIYNSEAEIDHFLATRIGDATPMELSGWVKAANGPVAP